MKPDITIPKHIIQIDRTCTACPSQWDAWTDSDEYVYIRYRSGRFRIDIMDNEESFMDYDSGRCVTLYTEEFGDPLDGYIDDETMVEHAKGTLTFSDDAMKDLTCNGPLDIDTNWLDQITGRVNQLVDTLKEDGLLTDATELQWVEPNDASERQ